MRLRRAAAIIAVAAAFSLGATPALACVYEPPDEECYVHHDAVPEQSHIVHHDAVTHEETVIDQEATPGIWQNFSPDDQQATFIGPPAWPTDPRGTWHHEDKDIPPGHQGPDGVYAQGNPDKGGNWFYRQAGTPEQSHVVVVIDVEAYDETVIDVPGVAAYDEEVPCDAEPRTVVPMLPSLNDPCGTDNDSYVLPADGEGITYSFDGKNVVATLTDPQGTTFGTLAAVWEAYQDGSVRLSFNPGDFTDVACEPVCEEQQVPVWHVWTGGPVPEGVVPDVNDPAWNANSGNPQSENHTVPPRQYNVPYFVSHGGSGNGDWFMWTLEDCPPPPSLLDVTPTLSYDPPTCEAAGELHLGLVGVIWDPVPNDDNSIRYTASPAEGYAFPDDAQVEWTVPNLDRLDPNAVAECRPDRPADKVIVEEGPWKDAAWPCNATTTTQARSVWTTTTPFVWSLDTRMWVEGASVKVEKVEQRVRALTAQEVVACPTVVVAPPAPAAPALASTGSDGAGWIALAAVGLTMLGGTALALRRRLVSNR